MHELLEALGQPQRELHVAHITGTKGKGSTATMLSAIMQAAEYRVGTYTRCRRRTRWKRSRAFRAYQAIPTALNGRVRVLKPQHNRPYRVMIDPRCVASYQRQTRLSPVQSPRGVADGAPRRGRRANRPGGF